MMAQVRSCVPWRGLGKNLLVETLALLHNIAMVQLLPSVLIISMRRLNSLRELARVIPPADVRFITRRTPVDAKSWRTRRTNAWALK